MPTKADRQLRHITRTKQECRAVLREAFLHACRKSRGSYGAVAKWLGKDVSTIRRWRDPKGKEAPDTATLMQSSRVWPHFLRCLVILERKAGRV